MNCQKALFAVSVTILLCATACSSLNMKADYDASRKNFSSAMLPEAKTSLPSHESGGFITLMEQTYLSLLDGKPDIDALFRYAKKIDDQVQYKVTREAGNFFYIVTPEDYYASEHEVIWMHFLLSWGFSMKGQYDEARVEAKKAADLLSMEWSPKGRFDDPFMRIFLASLWMMSGDWEEARVDLRKAAAMDPKLRWAGSLAAYDTRPSNLTMILCGCGPEASWNPSLRKNLLRGTRFVEFVPSGARRRLSASAKAGNLQLYMTSDSSAWYERHFYRNNEISSLIDDSKYAERMGAATVKAAGIATVGYTIGTVIIAAGLGVGGGLVYLGVAGGAPEICGLGVVIAGGGTFEGVDWILDTTDHTKSELKKDLDISNSYRYVRFLPEYAWMTWTRKEPGAMKITATDSSGAVDISGIARDVKPVNGVTVLFYPDAKTETEPERNAEEQKGYLRENFDVVRGGYRDMKKTAIEDMKEGIKSVKDSALGE